MADFDEGKMYDRNYKDIFSIKQLAVEQIAPKYLQEDTTQLTVGLEGMITEYVGVTTEDAFNTASTLLMETFPSRAQFSSSIYSNASIFQLSNIFGQASSCQFIIILNEDDIKRNFIHSQNGKFRYFYIDRDTKFFVGAKEDEDEIPFSLDYDIQIKAKYVGTVNGKQKFVYTASYMMNGMKNSASKTINPYIQVRRSKTGLISLSVIMHQYVRHEDYSEILENSSINYPTTTVRYDGVLAGMDVLYKGPEDSNFNTQLKLLPIFSQPIEEPFCYYKKVEDGKIILSFTPKDGYWQPRFNSELKIITYESQGMDGDFPAYVGDNIIVTKSEDRYQYEHSWMLTGRPISASTNGKDPMSTEDLRQLTIEGFTTANALTTNHDLKVYFNNFRLHYGGNEVLFLKKRDDAVERLFSAFLFVKKDGYFFPTNTLSLYMNILKLEFNPIGYYHMSPGYLFGYQTEVVYYLPIRYHSVLNYDNFYMNDNYGHMYYYADYELTVPRVMLTEEEVLDMVKLEDLVPGKLQWYKIDGDHFTLYDEDGVVEGKEASVKTENEILEMFLSNKVTFGRRDTGTEIIEFITDVEEEAKRRKSHLQYMETWKRNNKIENPITLEEYTFRYPYASFEADMGFDPRVSIFDGITEKSVTGKDFAFTNPFLIQITKDTGLVGYYLTYIQQSLELDFMQQNDDDAFTQFIAFTLHVNRNIGKDRKYNISIQLMPTVSVDDPAEMVDPSLIYNEKATYTKEDEGIVDQFLDPVVGYGDFKPSLQNYDKSLLSKNNLRVVLSFFDKETSDMLGYMEMIPTKYDSGKEHFVFEAELETDDFITADGRFRAIHRCPHCGNLVVASANHNLPNNDYYCVRCASYFKEGIINVREPDDLFLPIQNAEVEVTILYRSPDDAPEYPTDNKFAQYDASYNGYRWTNVYNTINNPVTFIEPLNMMRGIVEYQDYYKTGIDALDVILYDIPLLKWSLIEYKDEGMTVTDPLLSDDIGKFYYFMDQFKLSYDYLNDAKLYLRNCTNIDVKFYNTYGRSNNFIIGDMDEGNRFIDTNNIAIYLYIWVIANTDMMVAREELKDFIKEYIETINTDGTNDLYISNLMREIENNFAYAHHCEFIRINDYETKYQAIRNAAIKLEDLEKEERRHFVPEILTVNRNNINLIIQEAE